jgi:uncharacterized membrane protein
MAENIASPYAQSPSVESRPSRMNVSSSGRFVSILGGTALTTIGLGRRSLGGLVMSLVGGTLLYRGATGYCSLYASLGIDTHKGNGTSEPIHITEALTIDRHKDELYGFWRDADHLPKFMRFLEAVRKIDDRHAEWIARIPGDLGTVRWETEITEDEPGRKIAWRTLPGSDIEEAGAIHFEEAAGGRGTVVRIDLDYRPPGDGVGRLAAKLLNPAFAEMLREDMRRFKSLMETGEVPTIEGQPKGNLH